MPMTGIAYRALSHIINIGFNSYAALAIDNTLIQMLGSTEYRHLPAGLY